MDVKWNGHFVPNLSMGAQVVRSWCRPLAGPVQCPVAMCTYMIISPDRYLADFVHAGARLG